VKYTFFTWWPTKGSAYRHHLGHLKELRAFVEEMTVFLDD